jgi:DNA methylase
MKKRKREETSAKKPAVGNGLDVLYGKSLPATRGGSLYGAFPYPTKISPEAIALFIAAHTKPGDTIFDGFAGSGTTGQAAFLCENPPAHLRQEAKRLGLDVQWGVRNAVLSSSARLAHL